MSRDELEGIAERALKHSTADGCQIDITSSVRGNTRFAANQLSTAGDMVDTNVVVESWLGPKHASVQINDTDNAAIAAAVSHSEALARLAPDDPDSMPPVGAQTYESIASFFDGTAAVTPEQRAQAALLALQPARAGERPGCSGCRRLHRGDERGDAFGQQGRDVGIPPLHERELHAHSPYR